MEIKQRTQTFSPNVFCFVIIHSYFRKLNVVNKLLGVHQKIYLMRKYDQNIKQDHMFVWETLSWTFSSGNGWQVKGTLQQVTMVTVGQVYHNDTPHNVFKHQILMHTLQTTNVYHTANTILSWVRNTWNRNLQIYKFLHWITLYPNCSDM